jgi:hypothetical protein
LSPSWVKDIQLNFVNCLKKKKKKKTLSINEGVLINRQNVCKQQKKHDYIELGNGLSKKKKKRGNGFVN